MMELSLAFSVSTAAQTICRHFFSGQLDRLLNVNAKKFSASATEFALNFNLVMPQLSK